VRGALERADDGQKLVLTLRDAPEILALLERPNAEATTALGPATPDHVLRTKPSPLFLGEVPDDPAAARASVAAGLERFRDEYERYFADNAPRSPGVTRLDRLPRVLLVRGLGAITVGKTLSDAQIVGDVYEHTAKIINDACGLGTYCPVGRADLFDVEYWSLEQAKLKLAKGTAGALERRIAVVTGAARGIGRATAEHFLSLGAHVVVSDRDDSELATAHEALGKRFGSRVFACAADVTDATSVSNLFTEAILRFGGLDIVVSNAGTAPSGLLHTGSGEAALRQSLELNLLSHQIVARAASEVLGAQGTGGCLLFNASKSAFNPGPEFGPYAVPKAAVVALMRQYAIDLGGSGIRSNAVNADRVHTSLFSDELLASRAKARGVAPDEYFKQNLLRRETTALDVARAFAHLATAEATTGCVITVDGGNAAAFPR
jgi:NAD(P)-dependent dehydrogenase (short-subunit alcohol dehydrogenase family)